MFIDFKSEKKAKIRMGATGRSLQAQPKILKNDQNTKSTNQNENFPKKTMFRNFENSEEPKIRIGATRRNLQAQLKMFKNIIGTSNQPVRTKKNLRKVCFVP
jgi:hypothetical protein